MVRRSDRTAEPGRHGAKAAASRSAPKDKRSFGGRRHRSRGGDDAEDLEEQQRGVLNLNNPLIPRELDEDIDDDLAFNSDDEEKFGHFFRKPAKPSATAKKSKKSQKKKSSAGAKEEDGDDDEDDALVRAQLRALGEIDDDDDLDFHSGKKGKKRKGGDDDDDDDDYVDLADMLGGDDDDNERPTSSAPKDRQKKSTTNSINNNNNNNNKTKKKRTKAVNEDGVAKKRRRAPVTEEAESIYGTSAPGDVSSRAENGQTFRTAMRDLLRSTSEAESSTEAAARLERALKNKRNLIGVDVDDHTKASTLRSEVRATVAKGLDRYKSVLREHREAKHLQLPMRMPDSNPVPSTLGAIAAAAEARFADEGLSAPSAVEATNGSRSNRTSALRLAGTFNNLLTSAGISRSQVQAEAGEDGSILPFSGGDEENGDEHIHDAEQGNATNAPTTSYMAKLKSMLAYENARRRRLNRIKSKTYRRIQRKEKEREKERRDKAFELLNPEKARARLAEKLLKARVEERVTQKHKNTSKWVRHAKRFAQFDENTKDAINEQNLVHQRLMQKMEEDADEDEYLNAGHGDAGSEAASSEEERVVDYLIQEATDGKPSDREVGSGQMDNNNINSNNSDKKKKSVTSVLWRSIDENDDEAENGNGAGRTKATPTEKAREDLREMKFMKQAREREEARYTAVLDQLKEDIRRDMRGETVLSEDEPSDLDEENRARTAGENETKGRPMSKKKGLPTSVVNTSGRKAFTTAKTQQGEVMERIVLKRPTGISAEPLLGDNARAVEENDRTIDGNNEADDSVSISDGNNSSSSSNDGESPTRRHGASKNPSAPEKNQRPPEKEIRKRAAKEHARQTSKAPDDFAGLRAPGSAPSPPTRTRITILPTTHKRTRPDDIPSAPSPTQTQSQSQSQTPAVEFSSSATSPPPPKSHKAATAAAPPSDALRAHQAYLVARAFAPDDVDDEFRAAKAAQVDAVMKPRDPNASLPGWGEWGGADERLNARHQARQREMELQRGIQRTTLMKSRADAALEHVIINHDGVELVPDRMLLHMVPRPFSNAKEFARSMRHPSGPEWNSAIGFKDNNQPRVEVRQGQAVMPLDLSLRGKKKVGKTTRRKIAKVAL